MATRELARLYKEVGELDRAAAVYRRFLNPPDNDEENTPASVKFDDQRDHANAEGILFLAYYYRNQGRYFLAHSYCSRLLDFHGPEGSEAKALMRELRILSDANGGFESSMEMEDSEVKSQSRFSMSSSEFENARESVDEIGYRSS